jgi:hypothetical protein
MIGQGTLGKEMIGRVDVAVVSRLRHPERSRSSGGARDLARSAPVQLATEFDFGWRGTFSAAINEQSRLAL